MHSGGVLKFADVLDGTRSEGLTSNQPTTFMQIKRSEQTLNGFLTGLNPDPRELEGELWLQQPS